MSRSINTVIFDLGRVLFHWNPLLTAQIIHKEDSSFNVELYNVTQTTFWQLFDLGYITQEEMIFHLSKEFEEAALRKFIQRAMEDLKPLKFGVDLLEKIQASGYDTYILSNMPKEFHEWLEEKNPFLNSFKGAIFSYQVHKMKPDFQIYTHLIERYGLDKSSSLFIDDMESNVFAAKKVGLQSLRFEPTSQFLNGLLTEVHVK